jgi:outer membrane protein assembly factor BamA
MKKISFFIVAFIAIQQFAFAQNIFKNYINKLVNDTSDVSKPSFLIYPTIAYAPETNLEIGFNSLIVYYAKRDTTNRLSEINGFTFFTLNNQYGLWFDHAFYSHQDKWFFMGKIRLQSFPLLYHGIGLDTPKEYLAMVDANQIAIKERVLRKLRKNLFFGLEFDYQRLSQVNFKASEETPSIDLPLGSRGGANLGLGLGLVYDNRHNVLNVRKGFFAEAAYLRYMPQVSSFDFHTILSDVRFFHPIGKRNVFAWHLIGQFNGGEVPFNQLALLGGESIMRGYYTGRYRDKNQIATQVELRFLPLPLGFTKRIGAAVFGGTGTIFNQANQINVKNLVWSGGAGLRFLIFPKKDIYTRLDYSFTSEGGGIYLFIGEAF